MVGCIVLCRASIDRHIYNCEMCGMSPLNEVEAKLYIMTEIFMPDFIVALHLVILQIVILFFARL